MSYIADFSSLGNDNSVGSITIPLPNNYLAGDLLILWAAKDTSTGSTTAPSGWIALEGGSKVSSGHTAYCYYRLATGSESDPVILSTDTDEWSAVCIAVRDVDQTTPIDVTASQNLGSGSGPDSWPTVTTTADDELVLFLSSNDGPARNPSFDHDGAMVVHRRQDESTGLMAGWTIQKTAGALDNLPGHKLRLSDDHWLLTVAVKNSSGGFVPAHIDMDTPPAENIHQFNHNSSSTDITGDFSAINGQTTEHRALNRDSEDGIYSPYQASTYIETAVDNVAPTCGITFSSNKNLDGKLCLIHAKFQDSSSLESGGSSDVTGGQFLGLFSDSRANATFWTINALNLKPSGSQFFPVVIKANNPNSMELQTFGSGVDPANVEGVVIGGNKTEATGTRYRVQQTIFVVLNKYVCIGADSANPFSLTTFFDAAFSSDMLCVANQGYQAQSQFFSIIPLVIGNGSYPTFFSARYQTLEFPPVATKHANHQFMGEAGDLYFEINLSSSDEIDMRNSLFNMNGHTWKINSASSSSATYQLNGHVILNGTVELKDIGQPISGVTFDACAEIIHNGADLSGGNTISNSTALLEAITIGDQADLDKLANCTFDGNVIAILVEGGTSRTLTADNIKFLNNQIDVEYNGSGTLTWVNTNGADAAIVDVFDGNVVIESPSTLTLNGLETGTEVRVFEAGTTTEVTGDEAIAGTTFVANINSATTAAVDISIISLGYINIRLLNIDLTAGDVSIPVSQRADRQYDNP